MRSYLDLLEERGEIRGEERGEIRGRIKGRIKGKIETIQTVALVRFTEPSKRLTSLLKKLNDLELLEQIRQFILTAPSLSVVENFAESLTRSKSRDKRVVKKQAA